MCHVISQYRSTNILRNLTGLLTGFSKLSKYTDLKIFDLNTVKYKKEA